MKSEAQPVGSYQRTGLAHVQAEHLPERGVQQVGGGMVAGGVFASDGIDVGVHGLAEADGATGDLAEVDDQAGHDLLGVGDGYPTAVARDVSGVADLATAFGVERGLEQDDLDVLAPPRPR